MKRVLLVAFVLLSLLFAVSTIQAGGDPDQIGFGPDPCQGYEVCIADTIPNDPLFPSQYGPQIIQAPAAWDITTGGAVLAIVDTGIDCTHVDVAAQCVAGYNAILNVPLSGTENSDDHGHGTHVASTAAGVTNNGIGVAGICWGCDVMPVKVLDSGGSGSWADVAEGIRFAADNGASVISMSLGGSGSDADVESAVNYAHALDVLVVSACGNTGATPCLYPAAYLNSMAVSCTDSADAICSFSSRGIEVDISAPGLNILAAVPTGSCSLCDATGYRALSGTSMSTPHVSGVAGLIRALHPEYTNEQVYGLLEQSADDKGAAGFDELYGFGRLNAYKGVTQVAPDGRLDKGAGPPPTPTPIPTVTPVPPTPTPVPTVTPVPPTPSPTVTPSPTITPSPTATPTPPSECPSGRFNPRGKCVGRDH